MASKKLKEGMKAPDFSALSTGGGEISLKSLKGGKVVLYFYPKDNTPGCTKEACAFRDADVELEKLGATVLGVSKDSLKKHESFRNKHRLGFPLLSDPDGKLIEAYGVWRKKMMYGKTFLGIVRSTFLIDEKGIIRKIWRNVKVKNHAEDVLEALKALD